MKNFKNKIFYEIFVKTFYDGNNDGYGDLAGIRQKLDYLKWLGVDYIWLTPIFPTEFKDSGYDVIDYRTINPDMGTMEDFDELIASAKKYKIDIMLDMVFNHTSAKHEWFLKALAGDERYQNYYYFRKGKDGNLPPTNWKSKLGGSCWTYVPHLNKYYLHLFGDFQPDLNWNNSEVRKELLGVLDFWINKGVKGFRFDVCNLYSKPSIFVDDSEGDGRRLYTDGAKINEYFKLMNREGFGKVSNFATVGEVSSTTIEKSLQYVLPQNNELDMIFTFGHLKVDYVDNKKWTFARPDISKFIQTIKEWQIPFCQGGGWLGLLMNNHDQPRALSRFGNPERYHFASASCLATMIFLLRGIPFIYQGEEIGMTNYPFKRYDELFDSETLGNGQDLLKSGLSKDDAFKILNLKCRDHARTVMQWDETSFAGFTKNNILNQPVNPNCRIINVDKETKDSKSVLQYYRKLIDLRKSNSIFVDGDITFMDASKNLFIYVRTLDGKRIYVISNLSEEQMAMPSNINWINKKILLNNYEKVSLVIEPFQTIVYEDETIIKLVNHAEN